YEAGARNVTQSLESGRHLERPPDPSAPSRLPSARSLVRSSRRTPSSGPAPASGGRPRSDDSDMSPTQLTVTGPGAAPRVAWRGEQAGEQEQHRQVEVARRREQPRVAREQDVGAATLHRDQEVDDRQQRAAGEEPGAPAAQAPEAGRDRERDDRERRPRERRVG